MRIGWRFRRGSRLAKEWLIVALLALAGLVIVSLTGLDKRWNNIAYDAMVRTHAANISAAGPAADEPDSKVLIVAVDKRALTEIGPWPWDRAIHAQLLARLSAARPRSVLFDILFIEPAPDDAALAKAMREAGNVALPYRVAVPALNGAPYAVEAPVPPLAAAAASSGHAMIAPDDDGVVRRIERVFRVADGAWPHIAIATAHRFPAQAPDAAQPSPDAIMDTLTGPDEALLAFATPPDGLPTISAAAVLQGEVPENMIAGRDVLIGSMAAGLGDYYATPFGKDRQMMRGVELSANALIAERRGGWITPLSPLWALALYGPIMLVTLIAFMRVRAQAALILTVAAMTAMFAISAALFWGGYWLGPVGAAVVMALTGLAWAWRRLALVDDMLGEELIRLGADPQDPPAPRAETALGFSDPLNERIGLLRQTLSRMRDVTLSLEQVIDNLPDPTLVIDSEGTVIRANRGMAALMAELAASAELEHAPAPTPTASPASPAPAPAPPTPTPAPTPAPPTSPASPTSTQITPSPKDKPPQHDALPGSYSDLLSLFRAVGAHHMGELAEPGLFSAVDENAPAAEPLELITADQRHFLAASEQVPGREVAIVSLVEITALRRAMRERERALQFLSHDLRAPIAAGIAHLNRLASLNSSHDSAGDNDAIAEEARRHMQRALDLASSYVALVKAEEAAKRKEVFDIVACLEEAMDTLWPMAQQQGVALKGAFADHEVLVPGDRSAILRSIENLLRNAVEHSGGEQAESGKRGAVTLILQEDAQHVTIAVADGDARSVGRIQTALEAYQKAGNLGAGIGLGLAYCLAVARRHQGAVQVSAYGDGKAVSLILPRAEPERAPHEQ